MWRDTTRRECGKTTRSGGHCSRVGDGIEERKGGVMDEVAVKEVVVVEEEEDAGSGQARQADPNNWTVTPQTYLHSKLH